MPSFQKAAALLAAVAGAGGQAIDGIYYDGDHVAPCSSVLYCYGDILNAIQLAKPFSDSKTFVDMPTIVPLQEVQSAYDQLTKPLQNNTELLDFLRNNFGPAGREVVPVDPGSLVVNASFLNGITNAVNREFTEAVIGLWPNLTRSVNESAVCAECENSLLSIKRPFVIAGGRFREPYYWDSYWILHGLLRSGRDFSGIARNQIQNFLDFVEDYGFVPNGARVYYLNRSQPPLLAQMVRIYLEQTGDVSILRRAVPLLIKEHDFFTSNRTVQVTVGDKNHTLNLYNVANTEPRPESYYEDYTQVNNASYHTEDGRIIPTRNTTQAEKDLQYKNLASGAESGWDFSARFMRDPNIAANDTYFPLASYNIINIVPVELNAILYWNEVTIAKFLRQEQHEAPNDTKKAEADGWDARAASRSEAMHAVMWNETLGSYFDFNLTSGAQDVLWARDADSLPTEQAPGGGADQQVVFNVGQLSPFWTGAAPRSVAGDPAAVRRAFSRVDEYLGSRRGGIAPTNFVSGQQWDQPSVWPPHMHVLMEALLRTADEAVGDGDGAGSSEEWAWAQDLALRLGQRYFDSAYCTWRATGGGTTSAPPLPNPWQDLGGQMFEKYSDQSLNEAGGGGEYEVVVGFGWSNGVLIWTADTFRDQLQTPVCDDSPAATGGNTNERRKRSKRGVHGDGAHAASAVELDYFDATWTSENVGGNRPVD